MKTKLIDKLSGFIAFPVKLGCILIFALTVPCLAVSNEPMDDSIKQGLSMLSSKDVWNRRRGVEILSELGAKAKAAKPELEKALKDEDSVVRLRVAGVLGAIGPDAERYINPLITALTGSVSTDERVAAFDALCAIGPNSIPALKEVSASGTIDVRKTAIHCLACIARHKSKEAYLELAKMLSDPNREIRRKAVGDMGMIEPGAKEAVPALRMVLRDDDLEMRQWATRCLWQIGVGVESAIPELLKGIESPDRELRRLSVTVLGKIGPAAKSAVPKLISFLRDPGSDVCSEAIDALGGIGGAEAASAMAELLPLLGDSSPQKARAAKKAVAKLAPDNLPELIKGLKNSNLAVRLDVVKILGKVGPKAKDAVPGLMEMFRGTNLILRNRSFVALCEIRVGVLPKLFETLGSRTVNLPFEAAEARQVETSKAIRTFIDREDREAIPYIIAALSSSNAEIRTNLAEALKILIRPADERQDQLLRAISADKDARVRAIAAELMGNIKHVDRNVILRLMGYLSDSDARVRLAAIEGLLKIGEEASWVLSEIKNVINDPNPDVCLGAVRFAALFGSSSAYHIPELIRALDNPSAMVRATTAEVLGNIGPKGIQAAPKLAEKMNTDTDDLVRIKAEEALTSMSPEAEEIAEKLYPPSWGGK